MQSAEKGETAGKLLEPGDMFGDYTVEKLLGKGGMGAVYLARAPDGGRYAVKVMFPDMVKKGSDYRKRFAREAEFAMKIRHKNLISVYDVGEDPDTGLCYIIMDYVPGGSVADRLEQGGPLPMAEAVAIAAQVAFALEVAHRHGVIHRDIKPDNIMFDADGTPKLADLGVAKFTDGAHKTTVTTTGMIIGTPAYMAPEQMMDSHHIDARADIYALGVVLYEMLTGKRPNADSTAVELLAKAIKGEPLPDVRTMRPEVSAAVAHVLSLMCAPKPEGRPATALEAAQLLQKAVTGRLVLPKKPPRAADVARRKKKRAVPWALLAACVIVCALCAAVVANLLSKPTPQVLRQSVVITNVTERTIVLTNTVERVAVVTNLVGSAPVLPTNGSLSHVAAKSNAKSLPAEGETIVPYVSKSNLHAFYRSKDRKHIFLGTGHALGGDGFATPPYSLARIKEMISVGAEIIHFHVSRSKDGILFSSKRYHLENVSNGTGNARDYTAQDLKKLKVKWRGSVSSEGFATCEEILRTGRGKVLFNISGAEDYAREIEDLLNRLDAWESVILEGDDVGLFRQKYGRDIWRKFQTGEAQVMVGAAYLNDWRKVTPECMVWGRDFDLAEKGLMNIPERITCMFFDKPGPGLRTDDEAGWQKAISEGVTVLRTSRPMELRRYIEKISSRHDSALAAELVGPYGLVIKADANCAEAARKFLSDAERVWLPAAVKFYGEPDNGRTSGKPFVVTLKRRKDNKRAACRPGLEDFTVFIPEDNDDFSGTMGYMCGALLTRVAEPKWEHYVLYVDRFLSAAVLGTDSGPSNIQSAVNAGRKAEGKSRKNYDSEQSWRYASTMRPRWRLWAALEEVRTRDGGFMLKYSQLKNRRRAEGKIGDTITWRQTAELIGEAVGFDVVEIFLRYGMDMSRGDAMVSENGRERGNTVSATRESTEIFPCADPKSTKWKARSPWRYVTKYPPPSGGKKWMEPAFRDSGWKRTNKPLGVGKSKEIMRIADRWSSSTLYLRHHFAWKGGKVARVEFTLYHACSVKIYLNGDLVLEKVDRNDWWEKIEIPVEAFAAALRDGDNVLAVEAEDNFGVRYFDCGLTVEVEESK